MKIQRRKTRQITVGGVKIGGDAPVVVQSMTTTNTDEIDATVAQIHELERVGCEIVRVAVPDQKAAEALASIKSQIHIPLVADIHFDYKLALRAIEQGVDCLRINPGNIGGKDRVERVVKAAKAGGIPMRIGVNSGSLEKDLLEKYGYPTAEAMVESALRHIRILEEMDFYNMKISLKASHVGLAVEAYHLFSQKSDYPLHLGITEAGTSFSGSIKSAVGLGTL
ncbi:MAG: (E)-4-hydroxy-3-methylbut-2-enyl-diphosphate synthase, partial [Nitrospira sp.]|nr:(E)-4-hydroxy-3-methylbut-2-enyl-diphosphate synthase [Nitrospira sp.]